MNSICVIGRLTADPVAHNPAGPASGTISRFRVAVARPHHDTTDFFDVIVFGPTAAAVLAHVGQGRKVGVHGWLETTHWTAADGHDRYGVQIHATQVDFLERPRQ